MAGSVPPSETPASGVPLPPEALEFGTPTAEYRGKSIRIVLACLLWIPFALLGLGLAVAPFWLLITERGEPFPWAAFLFGLPVGLIVLGGALFLIRENIRNLGRRVLVFRDGLIDIQRGNVRSLRWGEVNRVWQNVKVRLGHTAHEYKIAASGGEPLVFTHRLQRVQELRDTILVESHRRLFPHCLQTYDSGGILDFDGLKASQQGLNNGKETLPWSEIKTAGVNALGNLVITKAGSLMPWYNMPASLVPNLHVLLDLVDRARGSIGRG